MYAGQVNIKLGSTGDGTVNSMPYIDPTVYAQALDGSNSDVFSPNQPLHDQIMAKITQQQNAIQNAQQAGQYFAPIVLEQTDYSKVYIFIAVGFAALYFLRKGR